MESASLQRHLLPAGPAGPVFGRRGLKIIAFFAALCLTVFVCYTSFSHAVARGQAALMLGEEPNPTKTIFGLQVPAPGTGSAAYLFTLPGGPLEWACFAVFFLLLFNFMGNFEDKELAGHTCLGSKGQIHCWAKPIVLLGRLTHFLFAGYSKFGGQDYRPGGKLPARIGMSIIYAGAFVLSVYLVSQVHGEELMSVGMQIHKLSNAALAAVCGLVHYLKRLLEVMFVHIYNDTSAVDTLCAVMICVWYVVNVAVTWAFAMVQAPEVLPCFQLRAIGFIIWVFGELSNFYHHLQLRWLRTHRIADSDGHYNVPHAGLFRYLATPHYFCEMFNWLGICLMVGHLTVWTMHLVNGTYLGGRSVMTSRYYHEKLPEYPKNRKHMVPFLF